MELWKVKLKESFSKLKDLIQYLEITESDALKLINRREFPLLVPLRLASKMEKGSIIDPLFLQFVPLYLEENSSPSFSCDPVQDLLFKKTPLLLHKYSHRVLIVTTQACAMHCRYCFRQNFEYEKPTEYDQEIDIIQNDKSIQEVILSGGDPLSIHDDKLLKLILRLNKIEHVQIIRFHTRFPIGIPERITPSFLNVLKESTKQIIFVIHSNHPKELDSDVLNSLKLIQTLNIPILCQTVLLKGVNNSFEILSKLSWKLISNGIIPYYLHQLDPVQGAMHFEVSKEEGKKLIESLRASLPGYAVFKYVQEIPKERSKTALLTN